MSKPYSPSDRQLLALTRIVARGKAKNPEKVKAKIKEIKRRQQQNKWLGQ